AVPGPIPMFPGNSDGSPLSFPVAAADTWVVVNQQPNASSFSVQLDPSGKSAGVYTSSVTITQGNVTNSPLIMPVVLVVNGSGTGGGTLFFSPAGTISFSSVNGSVPA